MRTSLSVRDGWRVNELASGGFVVVRGLSRMFFFLRDQTCACLLFLEVKVVSFFHEARVFFGFPGYIALSWLGLLYLGRVFRRVGFPRLYARLEIRRRLGFFASSVF